MCFLSKENGRPGSLKRNDSNDKNFEDPKSDVQQDKGQVSNSTSEVSSDCKNEKESYSSSDKHMICDKNENLNLAKPKYRFYNRRMQGSKLIIPKKDYQLMTQGKTLKFHNAKLGAFMEVRVAKGLDENSTSRSETTYVAERECSSHVSNRPSLSEKVHDNTESMEVLSEVSSCLTAEDNQNSFEEVNSYPSVDMDQSSHTTMVSLFSCSSKPKIKTRRRKLDVKTLGSSQIQRQNNKKWKIPIDKKVSSLCINLGCGCRSEDRKKNKCIHPPPLDAYYH